MSLQYYHGSQACLENGATLKPGNTVVFANGRGCEDVYVTTSPSVAMQFAAPDGYVYLVEPSEDVEPDFTDEHGIPYTFICGSAKVLRCVW